LFVFLPRVLIRRLCHKQFDKDEDEGSENIDLDNFLMAGFKAELSLEMIDAAIVLFRQVLDKHPITHSHHYDSLGNLASTLGVRFMYTNCINDLRESVNLRARMMARKNVLFYDNLDNETRAMVAMAKGMLTDFHKSISLHPYIINTTVFHLQLSSLALYPGTHPGKFEAWTSLADGLYSRFHYSHDISDLDGAISNLKEAVKCCKRENPLQSNILHRLFIMFATRFDFSADIPDLQKAFSYVTGVSADRISRDNLTSLTNFMIVLGFRTGA